MSERKAGWYWVKPNLQDDWAAEYFDGEHWNSQHEDYWPAETGPRIPTPDEPWQCVPREITAETGHKTGMIGDFKESFEVMCSECELDDPDPDCGECGGCFFYQQEVPVSWTTIKAIHKRIVAISQGGTQ